MVWVVTNSGDITADYLCERMEAERLSYFRLDSDRVAQDGGIEYRARHVYLRMGELRATPDDASHIWFRRPKPILIPHGGDEAEWKHIQGEWSEAIEGVLALVPQEKWINHPSANVAASSKMEQLLRANRFGLQTPSTIVTLERKTLREFWEAHNGDLVIKPLSSGYIERTNGEPDAVVYTSSLTWDDIGSKAVTHCPSLVQARVKKRSDVRITSVDHQLHAVELKAYDEGKVRLDIRRDNMKDVEYEELEVPESVKNRLRVLLASYRLRFAAVDFVLDQSGDWIFLEINPNGQWAWLDLEGVTDIADSFIKSFKR